MVGGTSRLDETLMATTMTRISTMDDSDARMYIKQDGARANKNFLRASASA